MTRQIDDDGLLAQDEVTTLPAAEGGSGRGPTIERIGPLPKLILTVGLPFSGKTAWAKEFRAKTPGVILVDANAMRLACNGRNRDYINENEPIVWHVIRCSIRQLFMSGHDTIILEANHNTRAVRQKWKSNDWALFFKAFNTPVETCIDNAKAAGRSWMIPTIERMAQYWEDVSAYEGKIIT